MAEQKPREPERAPRERKRPYAAPRLTEYGSVAKLTQKRMPWPEMFVVLTPYRKQIFGNLKQIRAWRAECYDVH